MNWHSEIKNWHKPAEPKEERAYVEIGASHGVVGIRDTKQGDLPMRGRPVVVVSASTFGLFLDDLRNEPAVVA